MTSSGSSNLVGANATTKTPDIHQSITTMASTTFTGKLITPANYGEKYLYEVNFSGGVMNGRASSVTVRPLKRAAIAMSAP